MGQITDQLGSDKRETVLTPRKESLDDFTRLEDSIVAFGTSGVGPGAGIPLTTEWLQAQKKALKEQGKTDATDTDKADLSTLSSDAQKLSSTKDERMLKTMRSELSKLDTGSENFLQEATEKLIDSVIDEEYGEHFKGKPGYANLQEKLTQTVLENPNFRDALSEFFDLLLLTEDDGPEEEDPEKPEQDDPEPAEDDDEEDYDEEEDEEK